MSTSEDPSLHLLDGVNNLVEEEDEEQRMLIKNREQRIKKHFLEINERPVDDISMEIFYEPHTITLLCLCIFGLTYTAFTR